jgi:Putative  PD-(D/E)XK family member, (DUF4420)
VSTDLNQLFKSLVLPLERPLGNSLSAVAIPESPNHRLAKDSTGAPCLLLTQTVSAPAAALRLQNLSVSYGVQCTVSDRSGQQEERGFTIIKCSSADPSLFPHFLRILSPIIATLGANPTPAAVRRAISGLVDLFQALATPAKKSVQGLWAELLLIRCASDPRAVAAAWHRLPFEHVDFLDSRQRIEVKSASNRRRLHHFSLVQLTPPANARLVVASVFVESVGGGLSLRQLSEDIRALLSSDPHALMRFDATFYSALGAGWGDAMEERFDLELANESLVFVDSVHVPKIDGTIPAEVSDLRFASDMSGAQTLTSEALRAAGGLFAAVAPRDGDGHGTD